MGRLAGKDVVPVGVHVGDQLADSLGELVLVGGIGRLDDVDALIDVAEHRFAELLRRFGTAGAGAFDELHEHFGDADVVHDPIPGRLGIGFHHIRDLHDALLRSLERLVVLLRQATESKTVDMTAFTDGLPVFRATDRSRQRRILHPMAVLRVTVERIKVRHKLIVDLHATPFGPIR